MAKAKCTVVLNVRAALWLYELAKRDKQSTTTYIETVLLRHLAQHPGVDLSSSPLTDGGSHVEEGRESR